MHNLVSVCIPAYNGASYLSDSIQSIIRQTHENIEILIVDDGSTDETIEIVKTYQKQDVRIKLVINNPNLGMVQNWNRCIDLSKGEWIKLHFQDDLMLPDTIERMLSLAFRTQVRLVLTDREYFFEEGVVDFTQALRRLSFDLKNEGIITPSFFKEALIQTEFNQNFIGEPILGLFHKSLIKDFGGYDERLRQIVDLEFWLKICLHEPVGFIPDRLHQFRVHKKSQGAENTKKRLISITSIDKVLIADKFLNDLVYQKVRADDHDRRIQKLMQDKLIHEFIYNGIFYMNKAVSSYSLPPFKPSFLELLKGRANDLKNYFFSRFY